MHPHLDHPSPIAVAHRGGSLENEENTLPAFAHAVALGYRHVETDVHLTADGEIVIHHDPTLQRMMGDPRAIAALTWPQIRPLRTPKGAGVTRLADLLEEFPGLHVNIEAKSDQVVAPLAQLLRRMDVLHRVGAGSFAPNRTRRLRAELGAALCWSPARLEVFAMWLRAWGLPLRLGDYPMVQVPPRFHGLAVVTPRFIRLAQRHGIQVQVWTVDDPAQMTHLLDMGVNALMTDRPTVLKQVLIERGQWRDGV